MSKATDLIKSLLSIIRDPEIPTIRVIGAAGEPSTPAKLLEARQYISGRFDQNIGIDASGHQHGAGQKHAHVYGRKGEEIVVVNLDGAASHGTKGRLHPDDADALVARGFNIPADRIIEWLAAAEVQSDLRKIFG